jgi:hypothetical protein
MHGAQMNDAFTSLVVTGLTEPATPPAQTPTD